MLRVLWYLHSLVVKATLVVSSLLRSLQLIHIVEAVIRRILPLLSFVVDALLVSTLLIWPRRV